MNSSEANNGSEHDFTKWERQVDEEPSVTDLINACREVLFEEDLDFISLAAEGMENEEDMGMGIALGLAFEKLLEAGVDDPEQYLRDKDILE
ncbi:MAG: hypothetical protein Q8P30_04435 [Candidatus Uhrbacteria bacterium]|nr:hypothetical protein [Candidatus Uhrbacteria bacterium]